MSCEAIERTVCHNSPRPKPDAGFGFVKRIPAPAHHRKTDDFRIVCAVWIAAICSRAESVEPVDNNPGSRSGENAGCPLENQTNKGFQVDRIGKSICAISDNNLRPDARAHSNDGSLVQKGLELRQIVASSVFRRVHPVEVVNPVIRWQEVQLYPASRLQIVCRSARGKNLICVIAPASFQRIPDRYRVGIIRCQS